MEDSRRRKLEACLRSNGFGAAHADLFPTGSRLNELFTAMDAAIARVQAHATDHEAGTRESRQRSVSKSVARDALFAQMEPMNRTSRVLAEDSPGLENKFRMPLAFPEQDLLNAARTFLANATPLKTEFIREEMPSDFLERLAASISDFETAINEANRTKGSKVSAHEAQDDDLSAAISILRKLDVVIRNKFAHDRAMLAEWTSASHIERHSPSKHPDNPPPAPPPASPSSEPPSGSSSEG